MGTIKYQEEQLIDLPIEAAWEMATDTNHFNHYAKLFHVQFSPLHLEQGDFIREAKANVFGVIPTRWKEYTFAWVRHEWFEIERIYINSPMKRALWKISLRPHDEHSTYMRVDGDFTYANLAGKIALERVVIPQLRGIFRYATEYAEAYAKREIRPQAKQTVEINQTNFDRRVNQLRQLSSDEELINRLSQHILIANDEDITGMQPYKWARIHGVDRKRTLELFLLATKAGLLQQKWSMLCPNCRVPKTQVVSLKDVKNQVHCDLCGVDYQVDFDRSIEMQFDVDPSIRKTAGLLYCINGPMNSTHILAQFRIPTGQTVHLGLPEWRQPIRYRILQLNDTVMVSNEGTALSALVYGKSGFDVTHITPTQNLTITNTCSHEIVFMVEELEWSAEALTARELTTLQVYRDLFATEALSPTQELSVGQITVLFTDLKESTAMYEKVGDALAYANVREHFHYLKQHIQQHNGAIVKTIGDAVMAVFVNEQDAFDAALAIQENIQVIEAKENQDIVIKMGFHQGTVIAVNANDLLDYFGRTVNIAARIQQLSQGQDVVMTKALYDQLTSLPEYQTEVFSENLKGVSGEIELIRVKIPSFPGK